jgi:hypothetical protein
MEVFIVENNKGWPFYLAEGLPDEVKSRLWLEAVAYASNTTEDWSRNKDSVMHRTDIAYAHHVKNYKKVSKIENK